MAAGSLKDAFTAIFADYTKQYGGSFAPVWGPSGTLRERLQNGEAFDIFASAALPHAQAPDRRGHIRSQRAVHTQRSVRGNRRRHRARQRQPGRDAMLKPDTRIGTSTPVADPAGDYTWEIFHRIEALRPGAFKILSDKAQQLFGGPASAAPVNGRPRLLVALDDRQIDLFIYYCSSAREIVKASAKYKSVELPPALSVGPEYGLTVSRKASPGAADFAMYLLSPPGQTGVKAFGFHPGRAARRTVTPTDYRGRSANAARYRDSRSDRSGHFQPELSATRSQQSNGSSLLLQPPSEQEQAGFQIVLEIGQSQLVGEPHLAIGKVRTTLLQM